MNHYYKSKSALLILLCLALVKCAISQGTWTAKNNFGGVARTGSVSFSIGSYGYMGTGANASGGYLNDFWRYDPSNDSWAQMTVFGGSARSQAVGFAIGSYGYVGTGIDGSGSKNDFWQYDPGNNSWAVKTNFSGTARNSAIGFSVGSYGYIGLGSTQTLDFWQYDPGNNSWAAKTNFPGLPRNEAVAFSIGDTGYVGTGYRPGIGTFMNDFYRYDPVNNTWASRANFTGSMRDHGVGFANTCNGFIGLGDNTNLSLFYSDFKQYDPISNTWSSVTMFPGAARIDAGSFAFIISGKAYLGTGQDEFYTTLNDMWEFNPSGGGCTLPIELSSFKGKYQENEVLLKWATTSEKNNDYFEIERSKENEAGSWETVGKVEDAGNTTTNRSYEYSDKNLPFRVANPEFQTVYYRLRQVDFDGKFSYSQTISVSLPVIHQPLSIYPNPANTTLSCELYSTEDEMLNVQVTDILGNEVLRKDDIKVIKGIKGINNLKVDINKLSQGTYFLKVTMQTQETQIKFIKQ